MHLKSSKTINLPRPNDELWIVTDASSKYFGLGATLYVQRNNKLKLAGYYSAKLKQHQKLWIPCEIEALAIAASLRHFAPYIIQSCMPVHILTDRKPCVQAVEKLRRGEFSTSPRIYSFLSAVSQYQATVQHISGKANIVSDYASRNCEPCTTKHCQICEYLSEVQETPVIHNVGCTQHIRLPYTNRRPWLTIQKDCKDLRRVHAHLTQGTRPSKKLKNLGEVKRYLNKINISRDGLLVVQDQLAFTATRERIVVPKHALHGVLTGLHLNLDHPTKHQLLSTVNRYFFALNMDQAVRETTERCHQCASLKKIPNLLTEQSTEGLADQIGLRFATDIIKREKQLILVLREETTSFTVARLIPNETADIVGEMLVELCSMLRPVDGPNSIIRTDPAPCFVALNQRNTLEQYRINLVIGRTKNLNKNPVAEKAIQELEHEILQKQPHKGPVSSLTLALAIERLNSRIRTNGLSSKEFWNQRDQFTHDKLNIDDQALIDSRTTNRRNNHPASVKSKYPNGKIRPTIKITPGDVVYLYQDGSKNSARDRYIVKKVKGEWCDIVKLSGRTLRCQPYRVRNDECYMVQSQIPEHKPTTPYEEEDEEEEVAITPPKTLLQPHDDNPGSTLPRRSTRVRRPPVRLQDYVQSILEEKSGPAIIV
ncbi:uncharacterized protein LOC144745256 [Ciona intestinalis]